MDVKVEGIDKVYVKLINYPGVDPIDLMFATAKKSVKIDQPLFTPEYLSKTTREDKIKFLKTVIFGSGHKSIMEHLSFTFEIWGVSRSMTHQAVRNRIASYLEGSLRYVDPVKDVFRYIVPMSLRKPGLEDLRTEYEMDMRRQAELYKKWKDIGLNELRLPEGKANELGRTTLPHSSCTTYTFTMNLASIVLLANKRDCVRAEEEFRNVVSPVIDLVDNFLVYGTVDVYEPYLDVNPVKFIDNLGAYCKMYGYCPEGKLSCGKYPTLDQLKKSHTTLINMKNIATDIIHSEDFIKPIGK